MINCKCHAKITKRNQIFCCLQISRINYLFLHFRTFPNLKWAQRRDKVYITIDILDIEKTDIDLNDEGKLTFRAESHSQKFGFEMELFKGVIKAESGWNLKGRNVTFRLVKRLDDREEYWPRLTKDKVKN